MKIRNLLAPALLALTAVGQAFAGYVGPDSVTYDYMVIQFFRKTVFQESYNEIEDWNMVQESYWTQNYSSSGIVVLGPSGLEDYAVSYDTVERDIQFSYRPPPSNYEIYRSKRYSGHYTTAGNFFHSLDYERNRSPHEMITNGGPMGSGLSIYYPTTVTGTTTSGSGWITVTAPDPDPIVGVIDLFNDYGPVSYTARLTTDGTQEWAMITWRNSTPAVLSPPEIPEWADEEYEFVEDEMDPPIEYPEEP